MSTITSGDILGESRRLIMAAPAMSALFLVANTATTVASERPGWEGIGAFGSFAASILIGYALVATMIERGGLAERNRAGVWRYLGLAIFSSFVIGLASLFLIIPGLYVWVRWTAAYAFLAADGEGVFDSLKSSYDLTAKAAWQVFGALAIPIALIVAGLAIMAVWTFDDSEVGLGISVLYNSAISLAGVLTTAIGLAVYSLLHGQSNDYDAVFG